MPVNVGGLGSQISFQDLQNFYGGQHPISLSEYYRGGAEVPSTSISGNNPYTGTTSFSGSGSGSGGTAGIAVNVVTTPGSSSTVFGSLTTSTPISRGVGNFVITDWPNVSYVQITQGGRGNHTIVADNRQYYSASQDDLPTATLYVRGGAFQSGDAPVADNRVNTFGIPANSSRVGFSGFRAPTQIGRRTRSTVTSPPTHAVSFTNNTGQNINVTSVSPGSTSSNVARGGTFGGGSGLSSNAWSFAYNYIDAGTGSGSTPNSDVTVDGVRVQVQTTPGTTVPGTLSFQTVGTAATVGGWFFSGSGPDRNGFQRGDISADTSFLRLGFSRAPGSHTSEIRDSNNNVVYSGRDTQLIVRGPAWQSGDSGLSRTAAQIAAAVQVGSGGRAFLSWRGNGPSRDASIGRATRGPSTTTPTTHDVIFTNNTGSTIILDSDSSGGARTLNNGESARVIDDATSPNWRFDYRYAPSSQAANTAIPTDPDPNTPGPEIGIDQFNAPGNAAP